MSVSVSTFFMPSSILIILNRGRAMFSWKSFASSCSTLEKVLTCINSHNPTPDPFPLLADVLQGVEGGGVGHQAHPGAGVGEGGLEDLVKDDLLELADGDGLLHHHLQQHPIWEQDLPEEDMSEDSKRLTSKLNLSAEPLLDSEDIEERVDTLLKRAGAPRDPWQL